MKLKKKIFILNLYNKLLGFLIKKGKKNKAKFIIDKAFFLVSKKTGFSMSFLLLKLFSKYLRKHKLLLYNQVFKIIN